MGQEQGTEIEEHVLAGAFSTPRRDPFQEEGEEEEEEEEQNQT